MNASVLSECFRIDSKASECNLMQNSTEQLFQMFFRPGFLGDIEGLEIAMTTRLLTFNEYIKLLKLRSGSPEYRP
jgi:hypothetical protein